jgi:peptidoglycan/xylan/chitin deacetylase (PgdA/CDA1 family)
VADLLVLCYHAVSADWPAALSVTPEDFENQLGHLVERGYRGATFAQALSEPPSEPTVAVTFDDAYRSVREVALPILDTLGLPATVFVPTAFPGRTEPMSWPGIEEWVGGPHEDELTCMSWDELRELADDGWEIGSHTHTHPRLTEIADGALANELERSRAECEERLDGRPVSIAYPYGDVDARVIAAVKSAGYRFGAALSGAIRTVDPFHWPRMGIYHGEPRWRWRLKLGRPFRRVLRSPVGGLVESTARR